LFERYDEIRALAAQIAAAGASVACPTAHGSSSSATVAAHASPAAPAPAAGLRSGTGPRGDKAVRAWVSTSRKKQGGALRRGGD
jgi:hypothetical protein